MCGGRFCILYLGEVIAAVTSRYGFDGLSNLLLIVDHLLKLPVKIWIDEHSYWQL
jgi:hypothetical protein